MTAVVISTNAYLLGGFSDGEPTKTFLTVSLPALIYKATSQSKKVDTPTSWKTLSDTPLYLSAPFTTHNRLLAAGGFDDSKEDVPRTSIATTQSPSSGRKLEIFLSHAGRCSCVVLPSTELLVVGGGFPTSKFCLQSDYSMGF